MPRKIILLKDVDRRGGLGMGTTHEIWEDWVGTTPDTLNERGELVPGDVGCVFVLQPKPYWAKMLGWTYLEQGYVKLTPDKFDWRENYAE